MSETYIEIQQADPKELFGLNEEKLAAIRKYFPQLRIILRGHLLKAVGDPAHLADLEQKMKFVLWHYDRMNRLTEKDVERIFEQETEEPAEPSAVPAAAVLVAGSGGRQIRALTAGQQALADACRAKDMVFAVGPAGSGKTYTAVALAVNALKNKEVKRIILTRPAVEAGENLGFLPGDMREKLDPYMQPLFDALKDMLPYQKLLGYMEEGIIEIAPLAFMRGRTLDKAFVILDEAQNATRMQMKMFLTRMGRAAKFVITGDTSQIDLPEKQPSGLLHALKILADVPEIGFVRLKAEDVVRHPIVTRILHAYEQAAKPEAKGAPADQPSKPKPCA